MQIQINTDHNIHGDERVAEVCEQIVRDALAPIAKRLTRVEVHLKDTRGPKGGEDIRATVEARPEGLRPGGQHPAGQRPGGRCYRGSHPRAWRPRGRRRSDRPK